MDSLYKDLYSSENLFAAWRHVKKSALSSANGQARGEASEFEHSHQRHLRTIGDQLRSGRFKFDQSHGVLKDRRKRRKEGKDPRPIVISSLRSRIVQRAILQVLQPRRLRDPRSINPVFAPHDDPRIGRLNQVHRSSYGVGGLIAPYGGVQPAIHFVLDSIRNGATHYFQSDIRSFFTKIPIQEVVEWLRREVNDERITELFESALTIELSNKHELLTYERLFPHNGIGVAQGSSLSALAGNILLLDFDHRVNEMGVSSIRYIDDLLMLSDQPASLSRAKAFATEFLGGYNMSLYEPEPGSRKAAAGLCRDAIEFLGCSIQPNRCVPSSNSTKKILSEISDELSKSKSRIKRFLEGEDEFDPSFSRTATIYRVNKKLYGWGKSFSFVTDAQVFRSVDCSVVKKIDSYEHIVWKWLRSQPPEVRARATGVPSMEQIYLDNPKHVGKTEQN
ncbi:MAG: reverse transcriptase domain-containing protein [Pseudomonadota bacterium]